MSIAGAILILIGSAFCLLAALGVLRFPDLYTRLHAASKAGPPRRWPCAFGCRPRLRRSVDVA